jgi:hypothetical protein
METIATIALIGGLIGVYFLFQIAVSTTDLLKEIKALRHQLQQTLTPEDIDHGYDGHPKATRQLVEKILNELQRQNRQ